LPHARRSSASLADEDDELSPPWPGTQTRVERDETGPGSYRVPSSHPAACVKKSSS
jgi:hypothetical protein